ncbi:MAG: amidase [Candidatus Limnocylindria bacterium]
MEACLARYEALEPTLRAFTWLDADRARRLAREADARVAAGESVGPLHGVPIAVKDIFDTAGIPTEMGSPLFRGRVPSESAQAVRRLESAGAIVVGKTVTAQLAHYHPGPTRNPFDPERTPGGSSMGSAAAVGAGIVPAAVGSQTNGSVIRPAAFCGVVGLKPTSGRLPLDGVFAFAPTLDHAGVLTTTVESAALVAAAMAHEPAARWWGPAADPAPPRLAAVRTREWEHASDAMRRRFEADVDLLASVGRAVEWPALPEGLEDAVPVLTVIMKVESFRGFGALVAARPEEVAPVTRDFVLEGGRIPDHEYRAAIVERERLVASFAPFASRYDAILTPPAAGEAPARDTTGDPRFCSRWTLVGAPAITIPTGRGPAGLPLGLQLVGAAGDDRRLLAAAAWAERCVGWRRA